MCTLVFTKNMLKRQPQKWNHVCLSVLNKSLDLHILIWYSKVIKLISIKRSWYIVHDEQNPRHRSFIRESISLTMWVFSLSGLIFIHLKSLDFGSILCGLAKKLSLIHCQKMALLPEWQLHSLRQCFFHWPLSFLLQEFICGILYPQLYFCDPWKCGLDCLHL